MRTNDFSKPFIYCLLILLTSLTGCTKYIEFNMKLSSLEVTDKIPLRAGLYMSHNFIDYTPLLYKADFTDAYGKVGEALSKGSVSMMNQTFKEVVILEGQHPEASDKVDVIVKPELLSLKYILLPAKVEIKWTITDLNDKVLYMNTFEGVSNKYKGLGESISRTSFTFAMENLFKQTAEGLTKNKWWEDISSANR